MLARDDLEDENQAISRLRPLIEQGSASLESLGMTGQLAEELGFIVTGERVFVPQDIERLDSSRIKDGLSQRARHWLEELDVHSVVGSTNSLLSQKAAPGSPCGLVKLAELQVQGRGRRGRSWLSPYGSNLALSMGVSVPQSVADLGGFSLCIGLAVVDQLLGSGYKNVEVKWPNDVLLEGRKVAGILIELQSRQGRTDIVIGIGVNIRLSASARSSIDQPVTDLTEAGGVCSRNALAATLISGVVDYAEGFAQQGFEPMCEMFNIHHRFHKRGCRLLQGEHEICGIVQGVTASGELILDTVEGIRLFNAGEVSLRETSN